MTKLIDKFKELKKNLKICGDLEIIYCCGDLCWDVSSNRPDFYGDPAFVVRFRSRYIAFQYIQCEIRYYMGINDNDVDYEFGILPSVESTALLAKEYFEGVPLDTIDIPRKIVSSR